MDKGAPPNPKPFPQDVSLSPHPSQVIKDKDASVRGQDFEKAGQLRDREMELKAKIQAVLAGAKEQSKAEADSVEGGGPTVTEADIASIVAQWTGIPIEKVRGGGGGRPG